MQKREVFAVERILAQVKKRIMNLNQRNEDLRSEVFTFSVCNCSNQIIGEVYKFGKTNTE